MATPPSSKKQLGSICRTSFATTYQLLFVPEGAAVADCRAETLKKRKICGGHSSLPLNTEGTPTSSSLFHSRLYRPCAQQSSMLMAIV